MKQVEVEILCQVITAQLGTLNTGDVVRTDEAFAKHLVEECHAAQYVKPPADGESNVQVDSRTRSAARKAGAAKAAGKGADTQNDVQTSAQSSPVEQSAADGANGAGGEVPPAQEPMVTAGVDSQN